MDGLTDGWGQPGGSGTLAWVGSLLSRAGGRWSPAGYCWKRPGTWKSRVRSGQGRCTVAFRLRAGLPVGMDGAGWLRAQGQRSTGLEPREMQGSLGGVWTKDTPGDDTFSGDGGGGRWVKI